MSIRPRPARIGIVLALLLAGCTSARDEGAARPRPTPVPTDLEWVSGDPALDALQHRLQPVLAANRKAFRGVIGQVRGFGAGDRYPQIWLRDSATIVPLARWYEPKEALASWLDEHLAHQQASGALFDWVAPGAPAQFTWAPQARVVHQEGNVTISADKNTTEADQESSAVLAAARIHAVLGDAWLQHEVAGRPFLQRLDDALAFVWRERMDERGLVVAALTADWGDVSPAHADQRAIYLDAATPQVAPLYANVLYVAAARALGSLYLAAGSKGPAARWREQATRTETALRRHLWRGDVGRFRIHAERPGTPPHPGEDAMLAFGGHAVAALHGLLDENELARLLEQAEQAHERYAVGTLAGSLLPPYPAGFFKNPILTEPWTYQNGGQWDWLAGRFLLALFQRGQAEAAHRHLVAIAARVDAAGGLFEWYTPQGEGRGSPSYAGSAAALGRAVVEGLFGIDMSAAGVRVSVRLGARPGRLRVFEPATKRRVAYRYQPDLEGQHLTLHLEAEPAAVGVELLLPAGRVVKGLQVDGKKSAFELRRVGSDRYVVIDSPAHWRELRIDLAAETPAGRLSPG